MQISWKIPGFADKVCNEDCTAIVQEGKEIMDFPRGMRVAFQAAKEIFKEDVACVWPFQNSRGWIARMSAV